MEFFILPSLVTAAFASFPYPPQARSKISWLFVRLNAVHHSSSNDWNVVDLSSQVRPCSKSENEAAPLKPATT